MAPLSEMTSGHYAVRIVYAIQNINVFNGLFSVSCTRYGKMPVSTSPILWPHRDVARPPCRCLLFAKLPQPRSVAGVLELDR